jgi:hypothetical protein
VNPSSTARGNATSVLENALFTLQNVATPASSKQQEHCLMNRPSKNYTICDAKALNLSTSLRSLQLAVMES